jgi:membrane glycosyltransferase
MPTPIKTIRAMAFHRRLLLGCATLALLLPAAIPLAHAFWETGWTVWRIGFFALFLILFSQVAFSFVVSVMGWWVLWTGRNAVRITEQGLAELPPGPRPATAVVMPIHNEEVGRVFQGLRTMYQSLQQQPGAESFDLFILSDTTDTNSWIAEETAWLELCAAVEGFGRIFYRKRRVQIHNKSGNIADFCRRWGANYRYMIVLDADSVMTGSLLTRLVDLMERNPRLGILQTATFPILGQTLFQRLEQFAAFLYRPIITAGLNFWQLRDATFWGHNAIIRVKPFMQFCAMPELPEVGPLGRRILSHDTIEAALMRRGGYEVWQAYDLPGSYEEGPPHLLAGLQRDRRWCHGNLQHLWLLFERGLKPASRFNILNGILAYANAPLWLLSIFIGVFLPLHHAEGAAGTHPLTFSAIALSLSLYAYTMFLLLAPKGFSAAVYMRSARQLELSGGRAKIILGVIIETLYSMLLGPILMLFYTRFVIASFCGITVRWGQQVRSDEEGPPWSAWFRLHWQNMLFAAGVLAFVTWLRPTLLWWVVPIFAGPILAVPLSRLTASQKLGQRLRRRGWFVTPEEADPTPELRGLDDLPAESIPPFFHAKEYAGDYGLLQAVLAPSVNAIHVSMLRQRAEASPRTREYVTSLADRLLLSGPSALTPAEKRTLLWDAEAMQSMHQQLWQSPSAQLHEWWQAAFRQYVESKAISTRRAVAV